MFDNIGNRDLTLHFLDYFITLMYKTVATDLVAVSMLKLHTSSLFTYTKTFNCLWIIS